MFFGHTMNYPLYLQFSSPGRLPDTGVPVLQHHSKVTDYTWDPFNDHRLVVGMDVVIGQRWSCYYYACIKSTLENIETLDMRKYEHYKVEHPLSLPLDIFHSCEI